MLLNIAGYHFHDIPDPVATRAHLRAARTAGVLGTLLVAPEGLNAFLCGPENEIRALMATLRALPGFAAMAFHESWTETPSFRRFLVRLKKEIITFRRPELLPAQGRAATVSPETLRRWLDQGHDDEGRPVRMVDTRNAFEVEVGTFRDALNPQIHAFTELPDALEAHRASLTGQRIVTFCTGGIRCEKAALWLDSAGYEHVVQLDGGILGWFEAQGGQHWEGELFVFDRRVSITPDRQPGHWQQDWDSRAVHPQPGSLPGEPGGAERRPGA